jgi:hypothetical protein
MHDDPKMVYGLRGLTPLHLHLSLHSNKREALLSLLFPRIRTHEWPEAKLIPEARLNNMSRFCSRNLKLQIFSKRNTKKMVYRRREAIAIFKAFMCAMVLASLDPMPLCCIFL